MSVISDETTPDTPVGEAGIHRFLRPWRKHLGYTLAQVGNGLGTAAPNVQRWEVGRTAVSLEVLGRLAAFYGVAPDRLLTEPPMRSSSNKREPSPEKSRKLTSKAASEFLKDDWGRLGQARDILAGLSQQDADDWLRLGRRLALLTRSAKS